MLPDRSRTRARLRWGRFNCEDPSGDMIRISRSRLCCLPAKAFGRSLITWITGLAFLFISASLSRLFAVASKLVEYDAGQPLTSSEVIGQPIVIANVHLQTWLDFNPTPGAWRRLR